VTVVRLLGEKTKLGPERLVAAGYGPYHPVVVDDGPLSRERNRRLELQLMPAVPGMIRSACSSRSWRT
jgi:chemotaxis protein MotB